MPAPADSWSSDPRCPLLALHLFYLLILSN